MIFYAIKQKSTGFYLPAAHDKGSLSVTCMEPTNCKLRPPRLYLTESGAKSALTWWLKGWTYVSKVYSGSYFEPDEGVDEEWRTDPQPNRHPDDFEVVKFILSDRGAK